MSVERTVPVSPSTVRVVVGLVSVLTATAVSGSIAALLWAGRISTVVDVFQSDTRAAAARMDTLADDVTQMRIKLADFPTRAEFREELKALRAELARIDGDGGK